MSEKSVNKRIRKILEQDLAEAVAEVLRAEANGSGSETLQKVAEQRAQTLGRFEASVRQGPPPPTIAPSAGAKWG
jgi:hypothetical protein